VDDLLSETALNDKENRLLITLQSLLAIRPMDLRGTLNQAADLIVPALGAEKIDVFLYDPSKETLVAQGTSHTPMGRRQHEIGMDRLPLANGGGIVRVFRRGESRIENHVDRDPEELIGFTEGLGVRSIIETPLMVGDERRGVLAAASSQPDQFSDQDLRFLETVAQWVGMVAHRTELTEGIGQAAREAVRQETAEELVRVLAHDLNNYLTPLRGHLQLIEREAKREGMARQVAYAERASTALQRLSRLVADLLDVGRLEEGLFSLSFRPVDLVALVNEIATMLRTPDADILVGVPEELWIEADPDRLRQALENLLTNALRYSPAGVPVTLRVDLQTRDHGEWVVITVQDQGPGISPEMQPRIFDRFSFGSGSTGLGIGLYLARGIAEAHGGELTLDSSPGQGAAFHLSLPVVPEPGNR